MFMTKMQIFMLFLGSFGMGMATLLLIIHYGESKTRRVHADQSSLPKVDCKFPMPKVSEPKKFIGNGLEMVE